MIERIGVLTSLKPNAVEDRYRIAKHRAFAHGFVYWLVFDRLDREFEERRSRSERKNLRLNRSQVNAVGEVDRDKWIGLELDVKEAGFAGNRTITSVTVAKITDGYVAAQVSLQVGDQINTINGTAVDSNRTDNLMKAMDGTQNDKF